MPQYVQFTSVDKLQNCRFTYFILLIQRRIQLVFYLYNQSKVSKVRYVKVFAKNFGKLPFGIRVMGDAFIFIDEITIK
jgi:hypothetical protein